MGNPICRACRGRRGDVVLDLGDQPPADWFPLEDEAGPDPAHPLQMWLCSSCGLAQLLADPTVAQEPRGKEPAALVAQAVDAVGRVAAAGLLPAGGRVLEYGSPHGGSWLSLLAERGLVPVGSGDRAEVVVDCFGLMHAADQSSALAERVARVTAGGVLLLQYQSLGSIIRLGQWSALRHGHYAYYSTTALVGLLGTAGFLARSAWCFDLYGGTILLAAGPARRRSARPDASVQALLAEDAGVGVTDPCVLVGLQRDADAHGARLRQWLVQERAAGRSVIGYGAASRAVAPVVLAGLDRRLLPAVVDASAAKQGRRMPGTDIPIVGPSRLAADRPDSVLLFLPDLLTEVRASYPEVEAGGGRWVDAQELGR